MLKPNTSEFNPKPTFLPRRLCKKLKNLAIKPKTLLKPFFYHGMSAKTTNFLIQLGNSTRNPIDFGIHSMWQIWLNCKLSLLKLKPPLEFDYLGIPKFISQLPFLYMVDVK